MAEILKYRSSGEGVRLLQRALNEKMCVRLSTDGDFGKLTEETLRAYQRKNSIVSDGVYGPQTQELLEPFIATKYINTATIVEKARANNIPASVLLAFRDVESKRDGFLPDGRPVILFERHKMHSYLVRNKGAAFANQMMQLHPNVCNTARGGYYGYEREHERLLVAEGISKDGAHSSASWGLFQIMGFNYALCGYYHLNDYIKDMRESEHKHLDAVFRFIRSVDGLLAAMMQRNYKRIAELYNGAGQVGYDTRLRDADAYWMRMGYR